MFPNEFQCILSSSSMETLQAAIDYCLSYENRGLIEILMANIDLISLLELQVASSQGL